MIIFWCRFLDEVKHRDLYIALSFISRMLEANGASMMSVASFAIMANQFQKNVGSALVILSRGNQFCKKSSCFGLLAMLLYFSMMQRCTKNLGSYDPII